MPRAWQAGQMAWAARAWLCAAALAISCATPMARAQSAAPAPAPVPADILDRQAQALLPLLNGAGDPAALFTPEFRAAVPEAQLRDILRQLSASMGKALSVAGIDRVHPRAGTVRFQYEGGLVLARLVVDEAAPYRVMGLLITGTSHPAADLPALAGAFAALPGLTSFGVYRLSEGAPQMLAARDGDAALAVGSAFKLLILAELVRATNVGERHWDDMVTLNGAPLPGGLYTRKPAGTQVSLREITEKMIAVSDNSATDILLNLVGRRRVEAMMDVIGLPNAARNRPMMGTLDMFKLKGVEDGLLARHYLAQDEAGRRSLLDHEIAAIPLSAIKPDLFQDSEPLLVAEVEWFFSPADLARIMDWLRRNSAGGPGAEVRRILSINPGISPAAKEGFGYVGYKGGSEPGVINMTLLLQDRQGRWDVVTASWNDTARDIDKGRFTAMMNRAAELAATLP